MKTVLSILLLSMLFFACEEKQNTKIKEGKAYFEYFKYTGNDPYFNSNKLEKDQFYNPILPGFYPDPSICQKGNDYYLVNSTFGFFPGVPIFHSKDLVHWKQIGHVLDRPSQLDIVDQPVSYGIYAPAISYNPHNDTFYMITTFVGGKGNFIVTAKDPAGSWSDPIWLPEVGGIDPSLFFDEDGKAYVVNNEDPEGEPLYNGHKAIWIQEFDVDSNKMVGPRKVIRNAGHDISQKPIWVEGPHLYKIDGYYYLMAAEGGTSIDHSEVIFRSKNIWGPYETNPNNPILTQRHLPADRENPITNTGHADIFQTKGGNWYAVFLACRPYDEKNNFNTGRETFMLPVTWENGWPTILEKDIVVTRVLYKPIKDSSLTSFDGFKKQGNFSYTDSFKQEKLLMEWVFLRTPKDSLYEIDKDGGIWINARDVNLRELKQPSAIFHRQKHQDLTVETVVNYLPTDSSDFAGLVFFQNEVFHLSLGVTMIDGKNNIVLQKANKKEELVSKEIINKSELADFKGRIELKASCSNNKFSFFYKTEGKWELLAENIEASYLSTNTAGGFIGTMIGLYASSNE